MLEKIQQIVIDYTGDEDIRLEDDTNMITDLGLSSMDCFSIVCEIEEAFGVEISDRAVSNMKTVGDLIKGIEEQL